MLKKTMVFFSLMAFSLVWATFSFAAVPEGLKTAKDFDNDQPVIEDSEYTDIRIVLSANVAFAYLHDSSDDTDNLADRYTFVTANAQGTKGYGFQNDYEGILVTKQNHSEGLGTYTYDGWTDKWMVMGNPGASLPGAGGEDESQE